MINLGLGSQKSKGFEHLWRMVTQAQAGCPYGLSHYCEALERGFILRGQWRGSRWSGPLSSS